MTKCLTSLAIKKMQIEIAACGTFTPIRMAIIMKEYKHKHWLGHKKEGGVLTYCARGDANGCIVETNVGLD